MWRRVGARIIGIVLLAMWSAPLVFSHAPRDAWAHDLTIERHDASAHRFSTSAVRAAELHHCVLCQWLSSLRPPPRVARFTHPFKPGHALLDWHEHGVSDPSRHRLPARDPPA